MIFQITGFYLGSQTRSEYAVNVASEADAHAWASNRGLNQISVASVGPAGSTIQSQSVAAESNAVSAAFTEKTCSNPACDYRGRGYESNWASFFDSLFVVAAVLSLLASIFGNSDVSVGGAGVGLSDSVARRCPRCGSKIKPMKELQTSKNAMPMLP